MKKHTNPFSTFLFLALLYLPVLGLAANGDDIEKKKNISKTYNVTSNDKLSIENSFGDVVISTWDKNVIQVDIEIGAKANSDQKAQEMLDKIQVSDQQSGGLISFKTDVGDINNNNGKKHKNEDYGDDRRFYIDYQVHMPAVNRLRLENSFGKTTVPDMKGEVNLTSKFGSLTAGKLDNVDEIDVEFGTADIGPVNNGNISFKFNSKSHIANVAGSVKLKCEFSGDVQFGVDNNVRELTVLESYSTVKMMVGKGLSASFDVHTSFGNFVNRTDYDIRESGDDDDQYGPRFDKDFSGKAGDGKAKIKIKSSFGKVRLTDAGDKSSDDEGDDDEKSQKKHSKKNTSISSQ
ncbi:MAG TPA: hypothetical protein VMI35_07700 [Puia sp.]|nr:hypothetical protein [Puia sp.]